MGAIRRLLGRFCRWLMSHIVQREPGTYTTGTDIKKGELLEIRSDGKVYPTKVGPVTVYHQTLPVEYVEEES